MSEKLRDRVTDRAVGLVTTVFFGGFILFCAWLLFQVIAASTTREVVP